MSSWFGPLYYNLPEYRDIDFPPLVINQTKKDLIGLLMEAPSISPIEYVSDGVYDRVLNNFIEHAQELNIPDHDEYDWNRIPVNDAFVNKNIYLQKPNKKIRQKLKQYIDKKNKLRGRYNWTNVVKLSLYFYRSGIDPKIVAYTFGDKYGDRIIKPFKILKHDWCETKTTMSNIKIHINSTYINWECKTCGLSGYSNSTSKFAIIPSDPLTCDEVKIRNIIL